MKSISEKLIIGAVYLPHEGSHYDQSIFDNLSTDLVYLKSNYDSPNICLIGDFNSRTGLLNDFVESDDHLLQHRHDFYPSHLDFNVYDSEENLDSLGILTDRINADKKN